MKQSIRLFSLFLLGCIVFSACGGSSRKSTPSVVEDSVAFDSAAIRIGFLPTLDALPLLVAEQNGLFDSLKADIQLVAYTSNMDIDTAFVKRRIHGALTDVCRAILLNSKNSEVKIVGATQGAHGLITQHKLRLRKISDLPERMIAIARNEASDWMLDLLLKEADMDVALVNRPQINNIQLRQEMVQKEMIDAAIVPEPYATQAVTQGDRLLWSSAEKQLQTGCIIFSQKVLTERETELNQLATAYNLAAERINNAPQNYSKLMQEHFGIDRLVTDTLQLPHYDKLALPDDKVIGDAVTWLKTRYDEADWLGFRILGTDYKTNLLTDNRLTQDNHE